MGLSKKQQMDRAYEYGKALANGMFKDFTEHPEYKGVNFKWESFPILAEKLARAGCYSCFPHKISEDVKEFAAFIAKGLAKELIKDLKE